jgi:hypothetical protein
MFPEVRPLLPIDDSPLVAVEVIRYVQQLGTVHPAVGRIVLK